MRVFGMLLVISIYTLKVQKMQYQSDNVGRPTEHLAH
jgi:hypothetical protein